jgi:SNF2 family DNA or RNA helicase
MPCQVDLQTPSSDCRKTLQTLALVWTALRQGPGGRPLIKRAVVVAPTTITQNWAAECASCL